MYDVYYGSDVLYAADTNELNELYKKAQRERTSIEAYDRETGNLVLFWCPDDDVVSSDG